MLHNKIDLTKHMPQHPVMKGLAVVFAMVGLFGLWGSLTHADLQIQSAINNVVSTFKELRITSDGSAQGSVKVILNTGGIRVDTGALGGPANGVLKVTPAGYVYRGLLSGIDIAAGTITGLQIADGSITTGHLTFVLTGGSGTGGGSTGSATFACPAGQALTSVNNGVPQCTPIVGTGDCGSSGYVQGWSSTGAIICSSSSSSSSGGFQLPGGGKWHLVSGSTSDIFYGTWVDDNNGNVAIGLDSPSAKLHIKGSFRVDTSGSVTAFSTGAGNAGGSLYTAVAGMKGWVPAYCTTMVQCIENTAFNPYLPQTDIRAIEVVGNYVYSYKKTSPYVFDYDATYPRCDCDTSAATNDCSSTNVSLHTDPFCVDVSTSDATYPGPGPSGMGFPYTPIPMQFYAYAGPNGNSTYTVTGAIPGLIAASARVGINTLTPSAALDVVGNVRFRSYMGNGVRNLGVDANGNVVIMPLNVSSNPWQNSSSGVIFYNGGNVGINTSNPWTTLHVGGDILATNYFMVSDQNLKENIVPITDALDKLNQLTGYSFQWKGTERQTIGIIAQEVEEVIPQLVRDNPQGFKSVEYPNLIALVIEAMKELNSRADSLSSQYQSNENVLNLIEKYNSNATVLSDLEQRVTALEVEAGG